MYLLDGPFFSLQEFLMNQCQGLLEELFDAQTKNALTMLSFEFGSVEIFLMQIRDNPYELAGPGSNCHSTAQPQRFVPLRN